MIWVSNQLTARIRELGLYRVQGESTRGMMCQGGGGKQKISMQTRQKAGQTTNGKGHDQLCSNKETLRERGKEAAEFTHIIGD